MTHIDGAYLELSFINTKKTYREFYKDFFDALIDCGLEYSGTYHYHDISSVSDYIPKGIREYPLESKKCDLEELKSDFQNEKR